MSDDDDRYAALFGRYKAVVTEHDLLANRVAHLEETLARITLPDGIVMHCDRCQTSLVFYAPSPVRPQAIAHARALLWEIGDDHEPPDDKHYCAACRDPR